MSLPFAEINADFMPSIYFIFLLVFLSPLSIIITYQLMQLFNRENQFKILSQKSLLKSLNYEDAFSLAKIYAKRRSWLSSLKTLEAQSTRNINSDHQYFNAIGFAYYSMKQYDLAKNYYLKALSCRKDYIVALQNLAKVYELTNNASLALETYCSILLYDPDNFLASEKVLKLKNRDSRI